MALEKLFDRSGMAGTAEALYTDPGFPPPFDDRPYIYVNMVSTADGKTLIGPRGSTAAGVGGPTDQQLMRRLQEAGDGVLSGAGTLRAGNLVYAPRLWRITITRTGDVPLDNRFFTDPPGRAIVFAPATISPDARTRLESRAQVRIAGTENVDLRALLRQLRAEFGIGHLAVEGGANLNYDFFEAGLVDELFLTIAPKLKGGAGLPTAIDGPGLPGRDYIGMELLSLYRDEDELYLRYRVNGRITAQAGH